MEKMIQQSEEVAKILKTMGHPKRLLLLCLLKDGERSVGELEEACQIVQSQVSQFLKRMEYEGLVKKRRDGNFIYYSIANEQVSQLISQLNSIFCA